MRGLVRPGAWFRSVLSAVLLAANVAAPFRTEDATPLVLEGFHRHAARAPVARVRFVAQSDAAEGFRAVVGLARSERDLTVRSSRASRERSDADSPTTSSLRPASGPDGRLAAPRLIPLRC